MPRFVVLHHELSPEDSRPSHWDLMLEDDGCLQTWELPRPPADADGWFECRQLIDHRLEYLNYEGPISKDRGHVTQWDSGTFQWKSRSDSNLELRVFGRKVRGAWTLARHKQAWRFSYSQG